MAFQPMLHYPLQATSIKKIENLSIAENPLKWTLKTTQAHYTDTAQKLKVSTRKIYQTRFSQTFLIWHFQTSSNPGNMTVSLTAFDEQAFTAEYLSTPGWMM